MKALFKYGTNDTKVSVALLILRLYAGIAMITHGYPKLINYSDKAGNFPDPFGFGSEVSLILTIFAEFFCSLFLVFGFLSRLVLIPLIITLATIIFVIHSDDPFGKIELPLFYLVSYIILYIIGVGKFSVDKFLSKK